MQFALKRKRFKCTTLSFWKSSPAKCVQSTFQTGSVRCGTNTARYSTVQCSTVQYSTILYSRVNTSTMYDATLIRCFSSSIAADLCLALMYDSTTSPWDKGTCNRLIYCAYAINMYALRTKVHHDCHKCARVHYVVLLFNNLCSNGPLMGQPFSLKPVSAFWTNSLQVPSTFVMLVLDCAQMSNLKSLVSSCSSLQAWSTHTTTHLMRCCISMLEP